MKKNPKLSRKIYSKAELAIIKRLYKDGWCKYEMAYEIHQRCDIVRPVLGIGQRVSVMLREGSMKPIGRGTRFLTKEAMAWAKKELGETVALNHMQKLAEHKTPKKRAAKAKPKRKGAAKRRVSRKTTSREVLGFTAKTEGDPNLSYTVKALRMAKMEGDPLNMFRDLLESAVAEGKTAPDVLDDLRQVGT